MRPSWDSNPGAHYGQGLAVPCNTTMRLGHVSDFEIEMI